VVDEGPAPEQSLYEGERVEIAEPLGDYDGANFIPKGTLGTVVGYATPHIKEKQRWTEESYWVRLDGDDPKSTGRTINRRYLVPLGPA
jgi:hypothetical protein